MGSEGGRAISESVSPQDRRDEGDVRRRFECVGLSLRYGTREGRRTVLEAMSFDVLDGEFVTILGGSGVGKTTLLRILGGLARASDGEVRYRGSAIRSPPEDVVIVFQDYSASLLPWRTVERNIALGIEGKVPAAEQKRLISDALELVGLTGSRGDFPSQLSGGMQQRVQIARALVTQPSVLLMDEPFGSLDAITKSLMQDRLQTIHEQTNTTIVFVTHDIDEAIYLSDRILILGGTPARVRKDVAVDLPRPRDQLTTKGDPRYLELRREAFEAIGARDADGS